MKPIKTPDQLTRARQRLGLSPTQMATALGVSYDTYKDWQSGRNTIKPLTERAVQMLIFMKDAGALYDYLAAIGLK